MKLKRILNQGRKNASYICSEMSLALSKDIRYNKQQKKRRAL